MSEPVEAKPIDLGKHNLLGVKISAVNYTAAVEQIAAAAEADRSLAVSALAVHGVMEGVADQEHRYRLNAFDLVVPDGQPVRWALRWLHGVRLPDRVYGPNLMLKVCAEAARRGVPLFLFGGKQELLDQLAENLCRQFPDLQIAGMQASKFRCLSPAERDETIAAIRVSGAKITLVGLGCPRQEVWTYEFCRDLSMPVLAVGAAFNFHAGILAQAPPLLQKYGLEWLFRLTKEPLRLWRRYLILNPKYLSLVFLQWTGLRTKDPQDAVKPTQEMLYG